MPGWTRNSFSAISMKSWYLFQSAPGFMVENTSDGRNSFIILQAFIDTVVVRDSS